jgi:hypothetical protein
MRCIVSWIMHGAAEAETAQERLKLWTSNNDGLGAHQCVMGLANRKSRLTAAATVATSTAATTITYKETSSNVFR